jgi:hypothetical protein
LATEFTVAEDSDPAAAQFQRTEQRGIQMLLKAIPAAEQQALVTDRVLYSTGILFKLLIRPWRKAAVVDTAHHVPKVHGRAAGIRNWRRHYGRAQEVEVSLPDGVLLLKSLDIPLQHLRALDPQTAFRLSQSRMQLELDQHPTHHNLWVFSQCLLAEAETLCLTSTTSTSSTTPIKLKQLDGDLSEVSSQDQQRGPQVKIQSTGVQAELLLCVGQGVHSWKKLQMATLLGVSARQGRAVLDLWQQGA